MTSEAKISNIIIRLKEVMNASPDMTLQKIADHTGVSLSTVTRVFAKDSEQKSFRYDSIKPIAKMLLGLDSLDEGAEDEKALKAIIQYKETEFSQLEQQFQELKERYEKKLEKERAQARTSIDFLKHQIELKDDRITLLLNELLSSNSQIKELNSQLVAVSSKLLAMDNEG